MQRNRSARSRAFTMVEVALSVLLLTVGMTATVKVAGWVAIERRAVERRQWATFEVANLMEHLTDEPWAQVTQESAHKLTLSDEIRRKLPDPELTIKVDEAGDDTGGQRLEIRLRWRDRGGWEAPVRLTAWAYRPRSAR